MLIRTSVLAVFAVIVATAGQLLLKAGMERVGYVGTERLGRPIQLLGQLTREPRLIIGLGLFGFSAACWLVVLSRAPLSFAYPFAGLTYVLVTLFGRFALHETIPAARWIGVALVIAGIVLVGRTAPPGIDAPPSSSESSTS